VGAVGQAVRPEQVDPSAAVDRHHTGEVGEIVICA
jgi:hypothetical protein